MWKKKKVWSQKNAPEAALLLARCSLLTPSLYHIFWTALPDSSPYLPLARFYCSLQVSKTLTMVDKAQLIGALAETALTAASSAEALAALHPMRMILSSPLAKIASYSMMVVAVGYTAGILFEKVFPNMPKFRRNVLGIRRRRVAAPPSAENTAKIAPSTPKRVRGEPKPLENSENPAAVPVFALPTLSSLWASACFYSRPFLRKLHF